MNRWLIVVGREYKTRVRKRAFILSTLLGPFLMVGIVAIMVFLAISTNDTSSTNNMATDTEAALSTVIYTEGAGTNSNNKGFISG